MKPFTALTPRPGKARLMSGLSFLLILAILAGLYLYGHRTPAGEEVSPSEYAEYENGTVTEILSDSCQPDPVAEGAYRGEQTLLVEMKTGQYAGETLLVTNAVGPIYSQRAEVGQSLTLIVSTYENGDHRATVYEYNRSTAIYILMGLFILVTILVGGKTGVRSILGLGLTVAALLLVLIPLLMKGWNTILTTFLICALVTAACFVILGGVDRKMVCACLGTLCGMALSMVFGLLAQHLVKIDGLRASDAEALLQLRQTGTPLGIRGLLVAGVIISAQGAVMDVAMSISSALSELKAVDPTLTGRDLWRSGMNIGRDMVGTMTNTLILAFLGSGFVLILYLWSLGLGYHQFMSSSYMGIEIVSGISSAIGVILAVPMTCILGAWMFGGKAVK